MEISTAAPSSENRSAIGSRLNSVQGLRATAALLVVWAHSIDAAEFSAVPRQAKFFHLGNFGAVGLDIFFILSGFIMVQVVRRNTNGAGFPTARRFLSRRITRIFPLYWVLTLVVVLEQQWGRYKVPWHAVNWVPTIFLLPSVPSPHDPSNAPLLWLGWSLMFEIYFYLVLTAFLLWKPRSAVRNTIAFLCAMVVVGACIGIRRPFLVLWMNPVVLEFVFGCVVGLAYGANASWLREKKTAYALTAIGLVLLLASIFIGYGQASESSAIMTGHACWLRVGLWGIPAALMVAGIIFLNPAMLSFPARLLVFLGDASYSIYLCTIPVRSVVEHFWRWFGVLGPDTGVFLGMLFCTAVGVLCYLLLERPMMHFFHNWYKPIPFRSAAAA
jgi:peptidoglycan/LPS O-acetylase OafA/YrhL